ncbi:hypothetical protein [Leucobacter sp. UCD-THU]|uniref:hypothetical protein n=1 Tax=Leucobacter sp. UCD-THU TaxID=1292023 RepID=UPI001930A711
MPPPRGEAFERQIARDGRAGHVAGDGVGGHAQDEVGGVEVEQHLVERVAEDADLGVGAGGGPEDHARDLGEPRHHAEHAHRHGWRRAGGEEWPEHHAVGGVLRGVGYVGREPEVLLGVEVHGGAVDDKVGGAAHDVDEVRHRVRVGVVAEESHGVLGHHIEEPGVRHAIPLCLPTIHVVSVRLRCRVGARRSTGAPIV